MEIMTAHIQVKRLLPAWETFRSATNIAPIRDAVHYQWMVSTVA
jgi:HTH-type transcriptional regulator/antitoxin HigA